MCHPDSTGLFFHRPLPVELGTIFGRAALGYELGHADLDWTAPAGAEGLNLVFPSVEFLGDLEAIRDVMLGDFKGFDGACCRKLIQTVLEIGFEPKCALIAIFSVLG